MRNVRGFLVLILVALTGCAPRNPLDWKISAATPNDYNAWRNTEWKELSPELQQEVDRAFKTLATLTHTSRITNLDSTHSAFCHQLDGRTIRAVLLEAYGLESATLLSKIQSVQVRLPARPATDRQVRASELELQRQGQAFEQQGRTPERQVRTPALQTRDSELQDRTEDRIEQLRRESLAEIEMAAARIKMRVDELSIPAK